MNDPIKQCKLNRFSPLELAPGLVLRNRVVVPPMASETGDAGGFVTEETKRHYSSLAQAGAGLVWVEYTYVSRDGRSEERQLGADTDFKIPGLAALAEAIHAHGAVAGLQLTHAGGKTTRELTDGRLLGPSSVPVPAKDRELEAPTPMRPNEISALVASFGEAARRAWEAGFELVELHSAHGYGLNQWLSPLTNLRQDRYGGDLRGRATLLLEIVAEIRKQAPRIGVSARIPGQDHLEGGLTQADMAQVARWLEEAGLLLLDVSSGLGGWRRPEGRVGEGYLVADAALIHGATRLPVIGVGGIETGDYIDQAIGERKLSLAAVGRAILRDPRGWRESVMAVATPSLYRS